MYSLLGCLVVAFLGLSLSSTGSNAEKRAVTENWSEVILNDDGTWHYASDALAAPRDPITCDIDQTFNCKRDGCEAVSFRQRHYDLIDEEQRTISLCASDEGCNQTSAIFNYSSATSTSITFTPKAFATLTNSNMITDDLFP